MKTLDGIQAVVTGGASGVGRATVEAPATQGVAVDVRGSETHTGGCADAATNVQRAVSV